MKFSYNNLKIKKQKGFTLLETLIAIAILGVAIGGAFDMAQKSLSSSAFSKDQTTAFFLASEGLELVRNIRDNTALYNQGNPTTPVDWLEPFKSKCQNGTTQLDCNFDINPIATDLTVTDGGGLKDTSAIRANCDTDSTEKACRLKTIIQNNITYYTSVTSSNAGSIYFRNITIQEADAGSGGSGDTAWDKKEAIVTSTVYWLGQSYSVSETLSNWN